MSEHRFSPFHITEGGLKGGLKTAQLFGALSAKRWAGAL